MMHDGDRHFMQTGKDNQPRWKEVFKMYEKALVPLDGSELAECALPHVMNLVKKGVVEEVILLDVVEIPSVLLEEGFDYIGFKNAQFSRAQKYLADLESKLSAEGVKVKTEVLEGNTAHTIIEYAKSNDVKLMVIATHGYTGMKHLMFGSVALRILHDAHVPVLLIRPESCR
jgi:nucleotide-binding universal stress UspA family protein